ncbi:MAG TPA: DUF3078 domain-containing protein [Lacibacter sp.]|nr:DUF3078 domain-containing protein [Lacibacter sp.]HMO88015.1 DUF3078 domain-containing protein [Lacibacter sp.]
MIQLAKKLALAALLVPAIHTINAQDKEVQQLKTEATRDIKKDGEQKEGWTKGGVFTLNLSQGASRNWAAGAERASFSINTIVNGFAYYKKGKSSWDNTLNTQYGIVSATSIGTRKNDDRIDLLSRYGYRLGNPRWHLSALGSLRTQFTNGFDYSTTPSKTKNSAFFAPAYLLLSPGILYKPNAVFDLFLSPVTSRWVVVSRSHADLRPLFRVPADKGSVSEFGAFATANFKKDIAKNMNLVSRLDLFSNYRNNPQNIDVFWTNVIGMKVNKYIGVTYNFDLIYDHDVQNVKTGGLMGTQLKSLLGVGFTATF